MQPWPKRADLHQKRALVSQWIKRIEITKDREAILKPKEEHGIDPDDESPEAKRQWRAVADKTNETTRLRTKIVWNERGWPTSMTEQDCEALGDGELNRSKLGVRSQSRFIDIAEKEPGAA